MKLTIDNKTDYRTDDLRRLIVLALKEADVWHLPRYRVSIRWAGKAGQCGGHGYLEHPVFQLTVPRHLEPHWVEAAGRKRVEFTELPPHLVLQLAKVAVHEIHHTKGEDHGDMPELVKNWWLMDLPWAAGLRVRRKVPAVKAKPDREQKAREAITRIEGLIEAEKARHQKNLKSLRTRLNKAKRSVRYYDRKAAATRDDSC